ncbi:MAG: hypothetical protein H7287_00445, partial [Thermoleophilia bacterium]|nr:hypothetical protein [Thermoleophilia bacterium]
MTPNAVPPAPELPFIDTHTVHVDASPEALYEALWLVLVGSGTSRAAAIYGRAVGCEPRAFHRTAQPEPGVSTLVGFGVERAEPPRRLDLAGSHHFSTYRIEFELTPTASGATIAATTRAEFP